MYNLQQIKQQIEIGGGWAVRVYYEELIARMIKEESIEFIDPSFFLNCSSGHSANMSYKKISTIFDKHFKQITLSLNKSVKKQLPIIENLNLLPEKLQVEFWIDELKAILDIKSENLTDGINKIYTEDNWSKIDSKDILYKWSFPKIESLYGFKHPIKYPDIEFIQTDIAINCWRRWYWTNQFKNIFLIFPESRYGFGNNQWLIYCLIHDAAHLLHLSNFNQTCNPVIIENLALMESFAMQTEYRMYLNFKKGYKLESELSDSFSTKIARAFNILALLERSLRIVYDKEVHFEGMAPEKWVKQIKAKYNIENEIYNFAFEFHGLPGLPTAYMLGMWALESEENTEEMLSNPQNNFISTLNKYNNHERGI